jgi:hypothetical protein
MKKVLHRIIQGKLKNGIDNYNSLSEWSKEKAEYEPSEWVKCSGEEVIIEGYKFFYVNNVDFGYMKENTLIEERSGVSVGHASNKEACINNFKNKLQEVGRESFERSIEEQVKKHGESPSYNRITYNASK